MAARDRPDQPGEVDEGGGRSWPDETTAAPGDAGIPPTGSPVRRPPRRIDGADPTGGPRWYGSAPPVVRPPTRAHEAAPVGAVPVVPAAARPAPISPDRLVARRSDGPARALPTRRRHRGLLTAGALATLVVVGGLAAYAGVATFAKVVGTEDDSELARYASGDLGVELQTAGFTLVFPRPPAPVPSDALDPGVERQLVTVEGSELSVTWFDLPGGVAPADPGAVLDFLAASSATRLGSVPERAVSVTDLGVPAHEYEVRTDDPDPEVHQVRRVIDGGRVIELRLSGSIARDAVYERFVTSLELTDGG